MKRGNLFYVTILIFLCAIAAFAQTKQPAPVISADEWLGTYEYTYTEQRTQGGVIPVIEYKIVVSKEGDKLLARFTADGYMSADDFVYTAVPVANRLDLYFAYDPRSRDAALERTYLKIRKGPSGMLVKTTLRGRTQYRLSHDAYFGKYRPVFKKVK